MIVPIQIQVTIIQQIYFLDIEASHMETTEKRKRGRPRKYPSLPNNGKTFNCVPTSRFLIYPKGSPLIKSHMVVLAKLIYHRSYTHETRQ